MSENGLSIELNVFNSCHSVNSSSFPHSCDFNISEICTVPTVFSGTPNPPAGTFVAKSSTVIVNCNTGYSSNNQNIASYPCEQIVSCSSEHILHYLQSYFRNCHVNVCQLAILHHAAKTYYMGDILAHLTKWTWKFIETPRRPHFGSMNWFWIWPTNFQSTGFISG